MGWGCFQLREVIGWLGRRRECRWRGQCLLLDKEERRLFIAAIIYASLVSGKFNITPRILMLAKWY